MAKTESFIKKVASDLNVPAYLRREAQSLLGTELTTGQKLEKLEGLGTRMSANLIGKIRPGEVKEITHAFAESWDGTVPTSPLQVRITVVNQGRDFKVCLSKDGLHIKPGTATNLPEYVTYSANLTIYRVLGIAKGAGRSRGENRVIYQDTESGQIYHRREAEFKEKMTPANLPPQPPTPPQPPADRVICSPCGQDVNSEAFKKCGACATADAMQRMVVALTKIKIPKFKGVKHGTNSGRDDPDS